MTVSFHKFGEYFPGTGDVKDVGEIETALKIPPTLPRSYPLLIPCKSVSVPRVLAYLWNHFFISVVSRCGPGEELRHQLSSS